MTEIQTIRDIQNLVLQGFTDWQSCGYVHVSSMAELLMFSYTAKAQYEGRWNFFERVSRGLIINRTSGEIVARPFDKFFNWGERGQKAGGHIVSVTEKLDGSLGILYRHDGYKIATRGSFESDQALWATAFLKEYYDLSDLPDELTLLFEVIYPENRVVVDYGKRQELILLAARNRRTGEYLPFYPELYLLAQQYGFALPKLYQFNNVGEIIAQTGLLGPDQEGWVVEFSDGSRWKVKGDRYLELHKLINGLTFKWTLTEMANGTIQSTKQVIPEEFLVQVDEWMAEIEAIIRQVKAQAAAAFEQAPKHSRKDFALWVQQHHQALAPYLFAQLDRKDITPLIYKLAFRDRVTDDGF